MSMNKFLVSGRLTADPELRFTQDGKTPVVNFALANNWYIKNEDGVTEQKTQYIPVSVFGPNAEKMAAHKKTGDWIEVEGHITIKAIAKEDGTKLRYTNLVAQSVFFGPNAYRNSGAQSMESLVPSEDIC